jgi:hypothetical protein
MIALLLLSSFVPAPLPQEGPAAREPSPLELLFEDLKLYGDFRLRHESSFKLDDKKDRNRQRLRMRVGLNYQIHPELLLGGRLVTGDADDPNSTHVTLGDVADDLEVTLDRLFLTYRPDWLEGAFGTAGKFQHPFYTNPVYGELVWDGDVQPEGVVLGRSLSNVAGLAELGVTVGGYSVLEQGDASDTHMVVGELRGRMRPDPNLSATAATSYYHYGDLTPDGSTDIVADNAGNAVADTNGDMMPDEFVSDFGIWNTVLGVDYSGACAPLRAGAQYVKNTRAEIDGDQAWTAGLAVGSAARAGDWRAYYQYQVVEQDAVFSAFAQDDFLFSTNHKSHLFGVNHQLTDKVGLHLWALVSAREETFASPTTDSARDQWRVRLDLNVKL